MVQIITFVLALALSFASVQAGKLSSTDPICKANIQPQRPTMRHLYSATTHIQSIAAPYPRVM